MKLDDIKIQISTVNQMVEHYDYFKDGKSPHPLNNELMLHIFSEQINTEFLKLGKMCYLMFRDFKSKNIT